METRRGVGRLTSPTALAIYDACVLHAAGVRDVLVTLASERCVEARWSDDIIAEVRRSLSRRVRALDAPKLDALIDAMDEAFRFTRATGYAPLIDGLSLPDPDDRHVLAAAIRIGATQIVTLNLRHFPAAQLAPHGVRAVHPDAFVRAAVERDPGLACAALRTRRASYRKPPLDVNAYLAHLARVGLPESAGALARRRALLA